jgi:transcriptional regulator with XRE-family HTH domain
LTNELRDKAYRDAYVESQIRIGLPFQVRALRQARGWKQDGLADRAQMTQPRIAEIERPGQRRLTLETLLRIASAFDVGLEVRFVPFSVLIRHSESFRPDNFIVESFENELQARVAGGSLHRSPQLGEDDRLRKALAASQRRQGQGLKMLTMTPIGRMQQGASGLNPPQYLVGHIKGVPNVADPVALSGAQEQLLLQAGAA